MIRYLSQADIRLLTPTWNSLIDIVAAAVESLIDKDFVQPVKPYLRYRNPINRIIAMPAYIGGSFDVAGLKWIASFPENIKQNIPRASSVSILNNSQTGVPIAILSSNELSGLRTAAVSGYLINRMKQFLPEHKFKVGIIGFGPIGQLHAKMVREVLDGQIEQLCIYDSGPARIKDIDPYYHVVNSWEEAYLDADISICCTTSPKRYIDKTPKAGSLHLNVSLRDYLPQIVMKSSVVIVDDWEEVCREDTDIHKCSLECSLKKEQVITLSELHTDNVADLMQSRAINPLSHGYMSFHPMGMAIFDLAISRHFYDLAIKNGVGVLLDQ